jgi:hypothetical protein
MLWSVLALSKIVVSAHIYIRTRAKLWVGFMGTLMAHRVFAIGIRMRFGATRGFLLDAASSLNTHRKFLRSSEIQHRLASHLSRTSPARSPRLRASETDSMIEGEKEELLVRVLADGVLMLLLEGNCGTASLLRVRWGLEVAD